MRFEEDIHWAEGLFLQPHHLQRFQRSMKQRLHTERSLYLPHTCGLIDFEVDADAFANYRVVVKRISAVMPSGEEISMPGNCVVAPLDLSAELENHREEFTVYLALPLWSEYDANLSEDGDSRSKRQFSIHETLLRDENSGDNEISMACHRLNARLTTDFQDNSDLELLPVLRLRPLYREAAEAVLELDRDFISPYLTVSADCPLLSMAGELNIQLRNRRNKILHDLTESGYTSENLSGPGLHSILQLRTLNSYEGRLTSLLSSGRITPFGLYLELKSLLGELAALQPMRDLGYVEEYCHMDCAPQFRELLMHIRSLIMAEGVSSYIKLEFTESAGRHDRILSLKDEHLVIADEYYLALRCDGDPRRVVSAVESGDNFKLVNPSAASSRVRGVKLTEMRYPPRFLPALSNTIWFKLDRKESPRIWAEICNERGILLDWAEELFPKLEAALYITVLTQGKKL